MRATDLFKFPRRINLIFIISKFRLYVNLISKFRQVVTLSLDNLMDKFRQLTASDRSVQVSKMNSFHNLKIQIVCQFDKQTQTSSDLIISLFFHMANNSTYKLVQPPFFTSTRKYQSSYLCRVPFPPDSSIPVCPLVILSSDTFSSLIAPW